MGIDSLRTEVSERWNRAARVVGIAPEAHTDLRVKILENPSTDYTFGAILNPHRFQRPMKPKECPLCEAIEFGREDPRRLLFSEGTNANYLFIPNLFPVVQGASLALSRGTGEGEIPMFHAGTSDGRDLAGELGEMFSFADRTGFRVYHNGDGAGASIVRHEHFPLVDFTSAYRLAGRVYGFEAATKEGIGGVGGARQMPEFPFAHIILDQQDSERIISFLHRMNEDLGPRYEKGFVPHSLSQGRQGDILVVPRKVYSFPGTGAGDVSGHMTFKDEASFNGATYESCISFLERDVFRDSEIDLIKYL
jgi:hypothetical protein